MSEALAALAVCFEPGNVFVNLLSGFPIGLVYLWFVQAICPPKTNRLYWGVNVGFLLFVALLKPLFSVAERVIFGTISMIVLVVLTTRGPLVRRCIVCFLALLLQFVGEMVAATLWVSFTGLNTMSNTLALENPASYLCAMVTGQFVVFPLLMMGLKRVCNRLFPDKSISAGSEGEGAQGAAPLWMRRFALFPLVQLLILYLIMGITLDVTRSPFAFVATTLAILLLCVGVDLVLLVQLNRAMQKREADLEAALLEERVAAYLQEMTETQNLLADTAKLRHDLRNHLSVIQLLAERGDYQEARAYLEEAQAAVGEQG